MWPRPACVARIHRLFVTNWIRPDAGINSGMKHFPPESRAISGEVSRECRCWCVRPISLPFTLTQSLWRFIFFWCASMGLTGGCSPAKELGMVIVLFSGHLLRPLEADQSSFAFKTFFFFYKDKPFHHKWLLMRGSCAGACHSSPLPHMLPVLLSRPWNDTEAAFNVVIQSHWVATAATWAARVSLLFSRQAL